MIATFYCGQLLVHSWFDALHLQEVDLLQIDFKNACSTAEHCGGGGGNEAAPDVCRFIFHPDQLELSLVIPNNDVG